jgi:hypothetical protein
LSTRPPRSSSTPSSGSCRPTRCRRRTRSWRRTERPCFACGKKTGRVKKAETSRARFSVFCCQTFPNQLPP